MSGPRDFLNGCPEISRKYLEPPDEEYFIDFNYFNSLFSGNPD